MRRIPLDIILPILFVLKLDHETVVIDFLQDTLLAWTEDIHMLGFGEAKRVVQLGPRDYSASRLSMI